jgi:chemotaxis signal transduction protein
MMEQWSGLAGRVEALRRAFDRSFADAPRLDADARCDLLAIRVAGDPYALRLAEVAGLFADRVVTPLPTPVPELLGIAGFRAALVPVYDLRALLAYPGTDIPRWVVTTTGEAAVALAFDQFETHVRVTEGAFATDHSQARCVREVARLADGVRPVLHLPSVLEMIKARAASLVQRKEP